MVADTSARHLALHKQILSELGYSLEPGSRILDFGCGAGNMVFAYRQAGFEALGCDLKVEHETNLIRRMSRDDFRIPFADDSFDFVYSDQVLEHVRDLAQAVSEIHRVMKSGALSLHIFPAKLKPTEAHTFVPLAGLIQNYYWLLLWAFLGVSNSFQAGKSAQEVAELNHAYLKTNTRYHSKYEIVTAVSSCFDNLTFAERHMIKHSYGNVRRIYPLVRWAPFVATLYGCFYSRVIFFQKPFAAVPGDT